MLKPAHITYTIGSIGFIAIGTLHTVVHAQELTGDPLRDRFDQFGDIRVSGQDAASWDLFQGTSLLMGFFSIAIGLSALGALRAVRRADDEAPPPLGPAVANVVTLIAVIAIGATYLGALQIVGGLFGIAMFTPTIVASLPGQRQRAARVGELR